MTSVSADAGGWVGTTTHYDVAGQPLGALSHVPDLPETSDPAAAAPRPAPLLVQNLLNDVDGLAPLLLDQLQRGYSLNAYLLAAGIHQITEDFLHPDPLLLRRAARLIGSSPRGSTAAASLRHVSDAALRLQRWMPSTRRIMRWESQLGALVQDLADAVADPAVASGPLRQVNSATSLLEVAKRFPLRFRREVLRLPSCFRSFDQQPADIERLVETFAERYPDVRRPIRVVGVRTSGSYLAPLAAAYLKRAGYADVRALTMRPGRPFLPSELAALRSAAREDACVLLMDDPPTSGSSLAACAEVLEHAGISAPSIILLLQSFSSGQDLPPKLNKYDAVVLSWEDWAVQRRLTAPAVAATMASWLGAGARVLEATPVPLPPRTWERSHVRARYALHVVGQDDVPRRLDVLVKGVGLGYFGEHALAVAAKLSEFSPPVYGLEAGLLYRSWLPEERRLTPVEHPALLADSMVSYVVSRNQALAAEEDTSLRLAGRSPVWEVASDMLSRAFRGGWPLARVLFVDAAVKDLLRVRRPSIVDGQADIARWFAGEDRRVVKVDFDERAFSNLDLACYDPAYDLACLAESCHDVAFANLLRGAHENRSGEEISPERWAIYQLLHAWDAARNYGDRARSDGRSLVGPIQQYFAETFFEDVPEHIDGELCAIDIDGVLEGEPLGFPSLSPAGALALRALMLHGYQPVLASGRSWDDIRTRCAAYHLAGGTAEYGAVVYNHRTGQTTSLLTTSEDEALARVRETLRRTDGVQIDEGHQHAVRAFRIDALGRRRSLKPDVIAATLDSSATRGTVRPIPGEQQTDFVVTRIDKGTGLAVLGATLQQPIALAVGDSVSDLPMLRTARLAFAPANADAEVRRAGIRVLRRPYQAGLAQAVAHLLGHRPGECPRCRAPQRSREADLLLTMLGTQENGRWGMVWTALRLARLTRRP